MQACLCARRLARAAPHVDCLTKVLRLAANLAIHTDVGPQLAAQRPVADALLRVLGSHSVERGEELVLNAVCALTNLSFYMHDQAKGFTNQVRPACPAPGRSSSSRKGGAAGPGLHASLLAGGTRTHARTHPRGSGSP